MGRSMLVLGADDRHAHDSALAGLPVAPGSFAASLPPACPPRLSCSRTRLSTTTSQLLSLKPTCRPASARAQYLSLVNLGGWTSNYGWEWLTLEVRVGYISTCRLDF